MSLAKLLLIMIVPTFSSCVSRPAVQTEEPPVAPEEPPAPQENFIVTEEIYTKTFAEIEAFIKSLNTIVRNKDYENWVTFLTDEYKAKTGDPEYLKEQSEQPILKQNNIVLNSLKDYFYHVVVPSRSQARLDDIEFMNENKIKAISIIRNTRGVLYLLVRVNDKWLIDVW